MEGVFGYNSSKVNSCVEYKGRKSPKFVECTNLYDSLGRIHSSNATENQVHGKIDIGGIKG